MAVIEFPQSGEEQYLEDMTKDELQDYLHRLEMKVEILDRREPKNMNSEAYEAWAEEHEVLEDAIDEVREFLDEMQ